MYHFGGVYVDFDFLKLLGALDETLMKDGLLVWVSIHFEDSIPNAFIASAPKHPFWLIVLSLWLRTPRWKRLASLMKTEMLWPRNLF
jgi:mannosyltransferase OCH1-like enzyme